MPIAPEEKHQLRELAKRYAELAQHPAQAERRTRARDINDKKPRRPVVWIHEIPWHEMDIDGKLRLHCESGLAREMEWHFRSNLFRWEYIQADMVAENYYPVQKSCKVTDMGLTIDENVLSTDDRNHIVSHGYIDQLDSFEKLEALHEPVVTADPEADRRRAEEASDILGDILPVQLQGHCIYHTPWDVIPRFRGVENVMIDLLDNPELMHATIQKFTAFGLSRMKQMEALGLLDGSLPEVHCTPAYVSGLGPEPTLKNVWFRGAAQMFSDVSPAMQEEFDLQYMKPLMAECGLVYYGCCEALDRKIPLLTQIPNLRKIGVSPWANPEKCAEQIGGNYVYSHKPNPAHVSGDFDPEPVRREITRVIETCQKHGCPFEFILKDISTVSYKPGNLIEWDKTVQETIGAYY